MDSFHFIFFCEYDCGILNDKMRVNFVSKLNNNWYSAKWNQSINQISNKELKEIFEIVFNVLRCKDSRDLFEMILRLLSEIDNLERASSFLHPNHETILLLLIELNLR